MVLGRLFSSGLFGGRAQPFPPPAPDRPVYAVGDIHGRLDLLIPLIDQIAGDAASLGETADLVFVGDAVDRGPESQGVVEHLRSLAPPPGLSLHFLTGNHEIMMLGFLDDPVAERRWLRFGGLETLMSYGIRGIGDQGDPDNLMRLSGLLGDAMGPHIEFLRSWRPGVRSGNVLVTHAGADPRLGAHEQPPEALAWGAPDFYRVPRKDGIWVVHGHTIVDEPVIQNGRVCIDTGAFRSGTLTALRMRGAEISFLTAVGPTGAEVDMLA